MVPPRIVSTVGGLTKLTEQLSVTTSLSNNNLRSRPLTAGIIVAVRRVPREPTRSVVPVGRFVVDAQLRDLAIIATIVLLFVLTLNVLALTRRRP